MNALVLSQGKLPVVLVTGLSGAGKTSILHALEDLGYETIDNPPLETLEALTAAADRKLAIGVDVRSRGFDAAHVRDMLARLRNKPALQPSLVFATADDASLLRRYSQTRRRHPLAPSGRVEDGIALERAITETLAADADLFVDTSSLPLPQLVRLIDGRYGADAPTQALNLVSFAFPNGLPRDADLVFDARFLRNPHYVPALQSLTGLDAEVGTFIEQDADFPAFFARLSGFVDFLLPRFVQEGKKYATIAVGCTGGQHRSVYVIEKLAAHIAGCGWRIGITHREAARFGASAARQAGIKE